MLLLLFVRRNAKRSDANDTSADGCLMLDTCNHIHAATAQCSHIFHIEPSKSQQPEPFIFASRSMIFALPNIQFRSK